MKIPVLAAVLSSLLLATAQSTVPAVAQPAALNRIVGTGSVAIPAERTDAQALDAVARAVKAANPKDRQGGFSLLGQWTLEERDPGNKWIRVALRIRTHYMAVCYRIENGRLVPDVPTSRNLKQNGSKIHGNAPRWINNFNVIITEQMNKVAVPAPATAPATPPANDAPAARFCEGCGRKAAPDARFCGGCGRKL